MTDIQFFTILIPLGIIAGVLVRLTFDFYFVKTEIEDMVKYLKKELEEKIKNF